MNSLCRTLPIVAMMLAIGCTDAPSKRTAVVCTGSSCSERDRSAATYDPSTAAPDRDPDGRVAALQAVAEDDPSAAYDLALRLFRGDDVPQDTYGALQAMRSAAERGDVRAQSALGRLYLTGLEEMGPDPREAERWLATAAAAGDRDAAALLPQARQARADDEAFRRRLVELRAATQFYWARGWAYRWSWGVQRWYPVY